MSDQTDWKARAQAAEKACAALREEIIDQRTFDRHKTYQAAANHRDIDAVLAEVTAEFDNEFNTIGKQWVYLNGELVKGLEHWINEALQEIEGFGEGALDSPTWAKACNRAEAFLTNAEIAITAARKEAGIV